MVFSVLQNGLSEFRLDLEFFSFLFFETYWLCWQGSQSPPTQPSPPAPPRNGNYRCRRADNCSTPLLYQHDLSITLHCRVHGSLSKYALFRQYMNFFQVISLPNSFLVKISINAQQSASYWPCLSFFLKFILLFLSLSHSHPKSKVKSPISKKFYCALGVPHSPAAPPPTTQVHCAVHYFKPY